MVICECHEKYNRPLSVFFVNVTDNISMKHELDTFTFELPLPKRRGRPSTGKALTPAQRKRAQRDRDDQLLSDVLAIDRDPAHRAQVTVDGWVRAISEAAATGFADTVLMYADYLAEKVRPPGSLPRFKLVAVSNLGDRRHV